MFRGRKYIKIQNKATITNCAVIGEAPSQWRELKELKRIKMKVKI